MGVKCKNCNVDFRFKKSKIFKCPNCGADVNNLSSTKLNEYKEKFKKLSKNIDEKKINKLVNDENKIMKTIEKLGLGKLMKQMNTFLEVIKNPDTPLEKKIIAATVIIYIINPINLYSSMIPIIGQIDDYIVIFIGLALLNINSDVNLVEDKPLIYEICPPNENIEYNYFEKNKFRIWKINSDMLSDYNLIGMNNKLIKNQGIYMAHPYLSRIIIPYDCYDKEILNDKLSEDIDLFIALGAERIKVITYDYDTTSSKINIEEAANTVQQNIDMQLEAKVKNVNCKKTEKIIKCGQSKYDVKIIDKLLWYFTNESEFNDIINQRIINDVTEIEFNTEVKSKKFLDLNMKANINKMYKHNSTISNKSTILRKVKYEIAFYPNSQLMVHCEIPTVEEIEEALLKRKNALNNNNFNYNDSNNKMNS